MIDILALAWQAVWRHKLRGLLAIAGVAVGITAIAGIISAETSWSKALDETFAQLGVTKVAVNPPAPDAEAMRRGLTLDDAAAVQEACSLATSVVPISWARLDVKVARKVRTVVVKAGGVGVEEVHGIRETEFSGRPLEEGDMAGRTAVCLLGLQMSTELFGSIDTIGRVVRIAGRGFTVVGTFHDGSGDHEYRQAMVGGRADAYIPITTAQRIPQLNGVHKIVVEADDQAGAAAQINALMRDRLRARRDAEFTISAATMKQAALRSRRRVSVFVALAGLLALVVAGIGVANLLFVSVAERAQEIGLRRAFGASAWAVAWQFLMESVVLCLAGAAAGVGAAVTLTAGFFAVAFPDTLSAVNQLHSSSPEQMATLQLPAAEPAIAWSAVVVAVVVAVITGVVAGIQPALSAVRIPPAEAIRTSPIPRYQARSVLTVLQLSLGVAAVLLLVSFYEGRARTELAALSEGQGAGRIWLQFGSPMLDGGLNNDLPSIRTGLREIAKLMAEPAEFRKLLNELTLFSYFDPRIEVGATVRAGARPLRVQGGIPVICGTVPDALQSEVDRAREADLLPEDAGPVMAAGSFFSDGDLDEARRVCVLPHTVSTMLFGSRDAIGETVVVGGRPFTVSGVLAPWLGTDRGGRSVFVTFCSEFPVLIPATTLVREFPDCQDQWYGIRLLVKDVMQGPAALRQVEAALLARLRLRGNVYLYPRGGLVRAVDVADRRRWAELRAGAGGIAALLVALVGLVNMLLVSVHESIREVGLRRALGALRSQVGWQFVREGAMLAVPGSVCGVLLGVAGARWLAGMVDVPVRIPVGWVVLSGLGAILAGCLASLGPALHAARIHPVEALRYE